MNAGIVSARYAHALLKYVTETGNGALVYEQVRHLDKCLSSFEEMRMMIYHPKATSDHLKIKVFATALGGREKAAPELVTLTDIVHDETGGTLELEMRTDPSIIGGFIFDIEGTRLDASVSSQLKTIRHQFIEKNRRIV